MVTNRSEELVTGTLSVAGLFTGHPIPPTEGFDPLASFDPDRSRSDGMSAGGMRPRIGYGCLWEPARDRTWSGSAWHLREAMLSLCDTVDIGVQLPSLTRTALKAIHTRYRGGRFTTSWCYSRLTDAYVLRVFRRGISENSKQRRIDAVLMIDALAAVPEPFFVYYDSSWDALISAADSPERYAALRLITPANMRRRREIQLSVYERATGVIAESHWLRRSLIEQSGVPPEKIHVIYPAAAARGQQASDGHAECAERHTPRRSLLCVSRIDTTLGFYRKGIDLIVDAVGVLRQEYDPNITLTLAGMSRWPLPGGPPDGVNVLGVLSRDDVAKLYDTHDVFVMPSRMEPFGLVFVEALSRGMPCVARNACAMPEVITPGVSGALIERDDPNELAAAIADVLADDDIHLRCAARAPQMAAYFSWQRTAREVVDVVATTIR
jgi:glycosyltransferase involved in cell wall biosynthesis